MHDISKKNAESVGMLESMLKGSAPLSAALVREFRSNNSLLSVAIKNFQLYSGFSLNTERHAAALEEQRAVQWLNYARGNGALLTRKINPAVAASMAGPLGTLRGIFLAESALPDELKHLQAMILSCAQAELQLHSTFSASTRKNAMLALRRRVKTASARLAKLAKQAKSIQKDLENGRRLEVSVLKAFTSSGAQIQGSIAGLYKAVLECTGQQPYPAGQPLQGTLYQIQCCARSLEQLELLSLCATNLMSSQLSLASAAQLRMALGAAEQAELRAISAEIDHGAAGLEQGWSEPPRTVHTTANDLMADAEALAAFAHFLVCAEGAAAQVFSTNDFTKAQTLRCLFDSYWYKNNHSPNKREPARHSLLLTNELSISAAQASPQAAALAGSGALARMGKVLLLLKQISIAIPSSARAAEKNQLLDLLSIFWRKADQQTTDDLREALSETETSSAWQKECAALLDELAQIGKGGTGPNTEHSQASAFNLAQNQQDAGAEGTLQQLELPRLGAIQAADAALNGRIGKKYDSLVHLALISKFDWLLRRARSEQPQWEGTWTSRANFTNSVLAHLHDLLQALPDTAELQSTLAEVQRDLPPWDKLGSNDAMLDARIYDLGIRRDYEYFAQPWTIQSGDFLRQILARVGRHMRALREGRSEQFEEAFALLLNLLVVPRTSKTKRVAGALADEHLCSALDYLLEANPRFVRSIKAPLLAAHARLGPDNTMRRC